MDWSSSPTTNGMLVAPTSVFIHEYWIVLVSWNSSTSTWPNRDR